MLQFRFDEVLESRRQFARDFSRSGEGPVGLDASHAGHLARGGANKDFLRCIQIGRREVLLHQIVSCGGNDLEEGLASYSRQAAGSQRRRQHLTAAHQENIGRCAFRQMALLVQQQRVVKALGVNAIKGAGVLHPRKHLAPANFPAEKMALGTSTSL